MFGIIEEGELTKKQRQALDSTLSVVSACYEDDGITKKGRTWGELMRITGLSRGALSKHLKRLIVQGVIKPKVNENNLRIFYEVTGNGITVKGRTLDRSRKIYKRYTITL